MYYNPNISPKEEYEARVREQKRLIGEMDFTYPVSFLEGSYVPEDFYEMAKGHENDKEGGERCFLCYEMRLREAAEAAKMGNFDYFTTTLSISPLKNAQKLNEIGIRLAKEYGIAYLMSDFKKKNGLTTVKFLLIIIILSLSHFYTPVPGFPPNLISKFYYI